MSLFHLLSLFLSPSLFLPWNLILIPRNHFPSPHPTPPSYLHTEVLLSLEIVKSLSDLALQLRPTPCLAGESSIQRPGWKTGPLPPESLHCQRSGLSSLLVIPTCAMSCAYQHHLPSPSIKSFEIPCNGFFWSLSQLSGGSKEERGKWSRGDGVRGSQLKRKARGGANSPSAPPLHQVRQLDHTCMCLYYHSIFTTKKNEA